MLHDLTEHVNTFETEVTRILCSERAGERRAGQGREARRALQGLRRLLQQVRYQGADLAIGPLWRLSPGALDITAWLDWFLGCLGRAIDGTDEALAAVLGKAVLWQHVNRHPVEERQRRVINRLLDGFEGFLTTSKYAAIATCSTDTALRDIGELVSRGILVRNPGGGRSTSYRLATAAAIVRGASC
jgi:hypothetical protein